MSVKTKPIQINTILNVLDNIQNEKIKMLACLMYWCAARVGEPLPYVKYEFEYEGEGGRRSRHWRAGFDKYKLKSKKPVVISRGIDLDTIKLEEDRIVFEAFPVFKARDKLETSLAVVPRYYNSYSEFNPAKPVEMVNPHFQFMWKFILNRKLETESFREAGIICYLFNPDEKFSWNGKGDIPPEIVSVYARFYEKTKKRLARVLKKVNPSFKPHQLRVSRATEVGLRSGNVFVVKGITRHRTVEQASQYVVSQDLWRQLVSYGFAIEKKKEQKEGEVDGGV